MDRFVDKTNRLPGVVQLAIDPLALAISILHMPFALTRWMISEIVNWINPRALPTLTRDELVEWSRQTHSKWLTRHDGLRQCNPIDVADGIALPVIAALKDAIDGLEDDKSDHECLNRLANKLIALPLTTAPDAHTIGLCIQRHTQSDTLN